MSDDLELIKQADLRMLAECSAAYEASAQSMRAMLEAAEEIKRTLTEYNREIKFAELRAEWERMKEEVPRGFSAARNLERNLDRLGQAIARGYVETERGIEMPGDLEVEAPPVADGHAGGGHGGGGGGGGSRRRKFSKRRKMSKKRRSSRKQKSRRRR